MTRILTWVVAMEFAVYLEGSRLRSRFIGMGTTGWWLGDPDPDATFLLPWLVLAPFCFLFPLSWADVVRVLPVRFVHACQKLWMERLSRWAMVTVVALASLGMSSITSRYHVPQIPQKTFGEVGPYIHDEFSYQVQAETYLAGRLWWPGVPRARELFHQMHVLNEDHFASRYFPATGAWLAPFVAIGFPVGASWCAGMIIAVLAAVITRRNHGPLAGALAGLLVAFAPGCCLINNMLLAHGPTLVGLMVCLYAFRRLFDSVSPRMAALAGAGLALAMLSRPLTAASVALPWGVWWFWQGCRVFIVQHTLPARDWWMSTLAMGTPLLIGILIWGWQNHAITGRATLTPYSLYNTLYTPRHVFGYHDSEALKLPPPNRHLKEFDEWAKPMTWTLAFENLQTRIKDSFRWSLGLIPLGMAAIYFLLNGNQFGRYDALLLASIISLHVIHLPYWLSGLLGYHYVFESGVLWLMLFAGVAVRLTRAAFVENRLLVPVWITGLVGLSIAISLCPLAPGTTVPRLSTGIRNIAYSTERYERFRATIDAAGIQQPALVLVKVSAADIHSEYVRNRPPFDGPLLVGRYRPDLYSDDVLKDLFPERSIYVYDGETRELDALRVLASPVKEL